jgi:DUF1680 family protein
MSIRTHRMKSATKAIAILLTACLPIVQVAASAGQKNSQTSSPSTLTDTSLQKRSSERKLHRKVGTRPARDYPVRPVPFTAVHFSDSFWAPRIETNRTVTIPFAFQKEEETGRIHNFERAAAALKGEDLKDRKPPGYPFDDSDVYKVIEGASYTLSVHPDPKLDAFLDELISKIGAAQEKDGYLYTTRSIDPAKPHPWAGTRRWELEKVDSHELYDLGHLYEAAVAHYQATGKLTLLDIALKTADLLTRTFGPGKQSIWPGHQITEMGLVKLYRVTGDERYLNLAKFMLDVRGPDGDKGAGRQYNQSHKKVVDQTEAVGHAVRATYMYSGMADVAALTGDSSYLDAIDAIWKDVVERKLYVTGGIGARSSGEAFGDAYELPNMIAYNETCAAVGNDYWNHRLYLLHGDAKYIDVLERTLYNGLLSGVSLDGKSFFYPNPLESKGQHKRQPWFGVACCPGNITRFLASLPGYVYAQQRDNLFVNLFVSNTADIKMDNRTVKIVQETNYPWDGDVKITVMPDRAGAFTINVRVPGWARNEAAPGDLYRFLDRVDEPITIRINGRPVTTKLDKGYASLAKRWKRGDLIELHLPMPVRRVVANEHVAADRGRVALQRGPLVYCAEWPDNPGGRVRNLMLPDDAKLTVEARPELLNGVCVIKGLAFAYGYDGQGKIDKKEQVFAAIPYYAWANRGPGEMIVWLPDTEASATVDPPPTIASTSKVRVSNFAHNSRAVNDQSVPRSSRDNSDIYLHWWPEKGATEWIEYAFAKPATVSSAEVYWFDDTGRGECRVPESWRLLYKDGDSWKPVETGGPFDIEKDRFNAVDFKPVLTSGLRLEIVMQKDWSAGVQEWRVK